MSKMLVLVIHRQLSEVRHKKIKPEAELEYLKTIY
jgi:hypothetical protein